MTDDLAFNCRGCGAKALISEGLPGWVIVENDTGDNHVFCGDCSGEFPDAQSLAGSKVLDSSVPGDPIEGTFSPVRTGDDLKQFVELLPFGSYWVEFETGIYKGIEAVETANYLILFEYSDFPRMTFTVTSDGASGLTLVVPMNNSMEAGPLHVYQHYRLHRMGFRRDSTGGSWQIDLSGAETRPLNLARIIVHLAIFVYDLNPQWISGVECREIKPKA
jgi:hypothetical protein